MHKSIFYLHTQNVNKRQKGMTLHLFQISDSSIYIRKWIEVFSIHFGNRGVLWSQSWSYMLCIYMLCPLYPRFVLWAKFIDGFWKSLSANYKLHITIWFLSFSKFICHITKKCNVKSSDLCNAFYYWVIYMLELELLFGEILLCHRKTIK